MLQVASVQAPVDAAAQEAVTLWHPANLEACLHLSVQIVHDFGHLGTLKTHKCPEEPSPGLLRIMSQAETAIMS